MTKRNFFKLIGGVVGSAALPASAKPQYKPFAILYNKIYPTLEDALAALLTAEIDREMIIRMLEIVSGESLNPVKPIDVNTRIQQLKNLTFDIKSHKNGYRIVVVENVEPKKLDLGWSFELSNNLKYD